MFESNITEIAGRKITIHQPVISLIKQHVVGEIKSELKLVSGLNADWIFQIDDQEYPFQALRWTQDDGKTPLFFSEKGDLNANLGFNFLLRECHGKHDERSKLEATQSIKLVKVLFKTTTGIDLDDDDIAKLTVLVKDVNAYIQEVLVERDKHKLIYHCEQDDGTIVAKTYSELQDYDFVWMVEPETAYSVADKDREILFANRDGRIACIRSSNERIKAAMAIEESQQQKLERGKARVDAEIQTLKNELHTLTMKGKDVTVVNKCLAEQAEIAQGLIPQIIECGEKLIFLNQRYIMRLKALIADSSANAIPLSCDKIDDPQAESADT